VEFGLAKDAPLSKRRSENAQHAQTTAIVDTVLRAYSKGKWKNKKKVSLYLYFYSN
jgi:hypothetical protein